MPDTTACLGTLAIIGIVALVLVALLIGRRK